MYTLSECTFSYLALVSVQAQSLNLNWSPSLNWSWRDSTEPTAAEDKARNKTRIIVLHKFHPMDNQLKLIWAKPLVQWWTKTPQMYQRPNNTNTLHMRHSYRDL